MSAATEQPNLISRFFVGIAARVLVGFFIFFIFILGCWVAGAGLHDPDTCWLLALGRYIWNHHALPQTDPYSFSLALIGRTFVLYQWLSELVFYLSVKFGGLLGLLILATSTLLVAFILYPLKLCLRFGAPLLWSIPMLIIAVCASSWHFVVRPEIFSYLFLSVWLGLLPDPFYKGETKATIDWRHVGAMALTMALWSNFHTGFVSGFIVLVLYILVFSLQATFVRTSSSNTFFNPTTAIAGLFVSLAATLLNPRGIGLWAYIPELFFSPINHVIDELKPIGLADLREVWLTPFLVLILLSVVSIIYLWKKINSRETSSFAFCCVAVVVCIALSFHARRVIPFASIIILIEVARLWRYTNNSAADPNSNLFRRIETSIHSFFHPIGPWWYGTALAFAIAGVFLISSRIVPPSLPQSSKAFQFPHEAIEWLQTHPQAGRMYSDAQYADAIIWYLDPVPSLFLDTRFDMYGSQLINEYLTIRNCQPGWTQLLSKYDVSWVFVQKNQKLGLALSADPTWKLIYSGDVSSIFRKM